jgi:hypothetical protein
MALTWWACLDLNQGPLPYQGVGPGASLLVLFV